MSPSLQTMGFFMSDINFCNTKEQLNHLGEVVTGKVDGSPSGPDIETSTLPYTGQVRKTLPTLESEYEQSISSKEMEADAAIDAYRLLSKGPYSAGITLESKFEYTTYNGESYFATNPPYTTTAITPDADGNLFAGGYTTLETVASKISNPNLILNSNFLTPSPDAITHPNATPESYVAGTQIFSGVYAGSSGVTVTLIDGRVNCLAGSYEYRVSNTNGLDRVPVFTSSVSDYDGKPVTTGVSHTLVGNEYVVTVTPAASDVFGVKFEQGSVATRHEVEPVGDLTVTTSSVATMIALSPQAGVTIKTQAYYNGWAAQSVPVGSAEYVVATLKSVRDTKNNQQWIPDGFMNHNLANGNVAMLKVETLGVDLMKCGMIGDDTTDNTSIFNSARDSSPRGSDLLLGEGVFKGHFHLKDRKSLFGAGRDKTTLKPFTSGVELVEIWDEDGSDERFVTLSNMRLDGGLSSGTGIRLGRGAPLQHYGQYTALHKLDVYGFGENIKGEYVVGLYIEDVISERGGVGALSILGGASVTTVNVVSSQFRLSKSGLNLQSGAIMRFSSCVIEANNDSGLLFNRQTSIGARTVTFDNCWFEKNGLNPSGDGTNADVYITQFPSSEYPSNLKFNECIFSPNSGSPAVNLNRGSGVEFVKCEFPALTSDYLVFNSGNNQAEAKLINCTKFDEVPSPVMYSSFPSRVEVGDKIFGFTYEYDYNGGAVTNYKDQNIDITGDNNDLSAISISTITAKSLGGNVTLRTLKNGVKGQVVRVVKQQSSNDLIIEHESTSSGQKIVTKTGANITLSTYGVVSLTYISGAWYADQ